MADAVNPNALGAPAEGFGQTVSFAFQDAGNTPQQQPVNSTGPQIRGSNTSQSRGAAMSNGSGQGPGAMLDSNVRIQADPGSAALAILSRVGDEVLKKNMEVEANKAYVGGMVEVMQGRALDDIKAEQPWYSKVFGDTPVVEGARAYSVQATVQRKLGEQLANLQALAPLDADQAASHFAGMISSSLTGTDPMGDAMAVKSMTEALPQLMKAQAKAHYGYKQLIAAKAEDSAMQAGGDALQAAAASLANGTIGYKDFELMSNNLVQASIMAPGRDQDSYAKNMTNNIKLWASKGNLHAINAMRGSGFMDKAGLTEEQQIAIDRATQAAELKASSSFHIRNGVEIGQLMADIAQPSFTNAVPAELVNKLKALDAQFRNESGSTGTIFGAEGIQNATKTSIMAVRAEQERQWKAGMVSADTERAAAVMEQAITVSAEQGTIGRLMYTPGVSSDKIHTGFEAAVRSRPPEQAAKVIIGNYNDSGYINPLLQGSFTAALRTAGQDKAPGNGALLAIKTYDDLVARGGLSAANAYFKDYAPQIQTFKLMSAGGDPATVGQAWQVAFGDPERFPRRNPSTEEDKKVLKLLTSDNSSYIPEVFNGGGNIRTDAAATLMSIANPAMQRWMRVPGMSPELAYRHAINGIRAEGKTEILGGFVFENQGVPFKQIMSPLGGAQLPKNTEDSVFKAFVHDFLKVPSTGTVSISPEGSITGRPQFVIWQTGPDGMPTVTRFDGDTLSMYSASQADRLRGTGAPNPTTDPARPAAYDPVVEQNRLMITTKAANGGSWAFGSKVPRPY